MSTISELSDLLATLSTTDDKASALQTYLEAQRTVDSGFSLLLPSTPSHTSQADQKRRQESDTLSTLVSQHGLQDVLLNISKSPEQLDRITGSDNPRRGSQYPPPIQQLGCANYDIRANRFCPKAGGRACVGCSLVRYCSKECQVEHWRSHKCDCQRSLNSKTWKPAQIVDERKPQFISLNDGAGYRRFGAGLSLWGNMPAIDVLRLSQNEGMDKSKEQELSLAFPACGDIRNIIRTVNELPDDYAGNLSLVLNDFNPVLISRNLVLLLILTSVPDLDEASEHALHLWYSTFQPQSYNTRVLPCLPRTETLRQPNDSPVQVTDTTTLRVHFDSSTWNLFATSVMASLILPSNANNAYNTMMKSPQHLDYAHRIYLPLKPSHRLAYDYWQTHGLFLPFSEPKAHLNLPNPWWRSKTRGSGPSRVHLLKTNPLRSWDIDSVIAAGKAHGTTESDIMGCGFFYVKDQLWEFARRLRRFKVNISIYNLDARRMPDSLLRTPSAPKMFDRIEVSNIVDSMYCGVGPILNAFGPLLNRNNDSSAIIGLFMNWTGDMPSGDIFTSGPDAKSKMSRALKTMENKLPKVVEAAQLDMMQRQLEGNPHAALSHPTANLNAFHENSQDFFAFLESKKVEDSERKVGLEMRQINRIVPPRRNTPIGSKHSSIVDVTTEEAWYRLAALGNTTHLERYVEWQAK